ncbi:hypothetical protein ACUB14_001712 [Pseudomonas aeruginosa]|uniref:Lipoprotein n=3 Tax=Pseudomonas aeruginosa TaxID=287 RepID=A0A5K1S5J6_PSEAI|nr:hypothetical protein [Pseudomonas aeruginosa]ELS0925951.1 hypothetical protein [Pseudomonas putida]EIU1491054.1 hypothetical protein [Pseudomonas aeruginosa]EIU2788047.1 hypothetical protein [Pseudomonas aeruginosa]EIU3316183.1 hypothetical protein [Pseudomonas aeruginosa]EIU3359340.1 hypothetical protein [Pseudomonas aeruginosa]
MVKRSFATLTALAAALTLAGCSSTCFKETPAQQVATFEFVIKEIDANKHERVLQRPRIAAQINTQAEWRQLHIVKEGALEKSRSGYIVAIHPYAVPGKRQSEKAVTFDLVVDQFIPEIGATQLATSGTGAVVNGGESTIFWTAAGKKYTLETRLVSLD